MNPAQALSSSFEDYLEAIFTIVAKNRVARSKDIAEKLKVKRPSVTGALKALAEKGLVNYQPHSYITLSSEGEKIARWVDERHKVLKDLFTEVLKLPANESEKAACYMEHGVNANVYKSLRSLLMAVRNNEELARMLQIGMEAEKENIDYTTFFDSVAIGMGNGNVTAPAFTLNILTSGESGTIERIVGNDTLKKRLREMGITSGQEVRVVKSAPLDDPIEIKVRNYNISLRREEADKIIIKR
jgi:DtxR family transcriptional regulator, Mn-dependent transcriptional regulator